MNTGYQIYLAEHAGSAAGQRDEARRTGELAIAVARLRRRRRSPSAPARAPSPETCGSCG